MDPHENQETPSDRIVRLGLRSVHATDLLSVALTPEGGDEQGICDRIAQELLKKGGLNRLGQLGPVDLAELSPLPTREVNRILAAIEFGRRLGNTAKGVLPTIGGAKDVFQRFRWLQDEQREHFCVILLDAKSHVLVEKTIHIGTVDSTVVGPREVFREAIREGAASLIVVHNHPSGDPTPSEADYEVTEKLAQVGEMLAIPLLDHIIIGHHAYRSFRELRYL